MTHKNQTIIPAAPGWSQVTPIIGDSDQVEDLHLEPVIAWLVAYGHSSHDVPFADPEPITVEGIGRENSIFQRPDGTFTEPYCGDFKDKSDMIRELNSADHGEEDLNEQTTVNG